MEHAHGERGHATQEAALILIGVEGMNEVTRILSSAQEDPRAAEQLLPLVYGELRKLAAARLASEKPGQTLQPTALVHEAYMRLVGGESSDAWNSRGHFFAAAAESMRRILIDQARAKGAAKRGGNFHRVEAAEIVQPTGTDAIDLLALDEALAELEREHPENALMVKLRFFAGFNLEDSAAAAGVSRATAERRWAFARAWLFGKLNHA